MGAALFVFIRAHPWLKSTTAPVPGASPPLPASTPLLLHAGPAIPARVPDSAALRRSRVVRPPLHGMLARPVRDRRRGAAGPQDCRTPRAPFRPVRAVAP